MEEVRGEGQAERLVEVSVVEEVRGVEEEEK